jgi:putative transposase
LTALGFICSCPDHLYRGVKCKHIHGVEFSFALRQQVKNEVVVSQINIKLCPRCQSENIVKHGIHHNKYGDIQRFYCNDCDKWFSINLGFEKMHASPQMIRQL